jgi:hypothetical protein
MILPAESLLTEWPKAAAMYGCAALLHMVATCWRDRDRLGMLLLLWILIPAPAVIYHHLPIKYFVPTLPAVILFSMRTLGRLPWAWERFAYAALAVFGVCYSCLLLSADFEFAEHSRIAAERLIAPHVNAGERVWYRGQWGFYWYAKEAGAEFADPTRSSLQRGDLIAIGALDGSARALLDFPNRDLVDSVRFAAPYGHTVGYGGGLYSNHMGYSLWAWNPEATTNYEIWRIK